MDDGRGDARPFAAVAAIDILHHLLAPLMLEIDVDVGRLAAFLGQEAGEEQVVLDRIDRGDPEQVADQAIGRRPAPLAEDRRILRPGEMHDVVNGEEIIGVLAFADEAELLVQHLLPFWRQAVGKAPFRLRHHQMLEPALRASSLPGTGSCGYS